MSRITPIEVNKATGQLSEMYGAIKAGLGSVPNMFQALGVSPRALSGFLGLGASLKGGLLSPSEVESIALAVAEANGCEYCLAAHSTLGKMRGIKDDEIIRNRKGHSDDSKRQALLALVGEIVKSKGRVSDQTFNAFISAGYTEAHVPEVLVVVVENIFTNYFNNLNGTTVDFPAASKL